MSESQSFRTRVCVFASFDRLFDSFRMHKEKAALTLKLGTFLPTNRELEGDDQSELKL